MWSVLLESLLQVHRWDAFQNTSSNLSQVNQKSLALKETHLKKPTHPPLLPLSWVEPDGGVICCDFQCV